MVEHRLVQRNRQGFLSSEPDRVRELLRIVDPGDLERANADPVVRDPEPDTRLRQLVLAEEDLQHPGQLLRLAQLTPDDDPAVEWDPGHAHDPRTALVDDLGGRDLRGADLESDDPVVDPGKRLALLLRPPPLLLGEAIRCATRVPALAARRRARLRLGFWLGVERRRRLCGVRLVGGGVRGNRHCRLLGRRLRIHLEWRRARREESRWADRWRVGQRRLRLRRNIDRRHARRGKLCGPDRRRVRQCFRWRHRRGDRRNDEWLVRFACERRRLDRLGRRRRDRLGRRRLYGFRRGRSEIRLRLPAEADLLLPDRRLRRLRDRRLCLLRLRLSPEADLLLPDRDVVVSCHVSSPRASGPRPWTAPHRRSARSARAADPGSSSSQARSPS